MNWSDALTFFLSETGKEVQTRLEFWQGKLHEIEEKYLELSEKSVSSSVTNQNHKRKKRQKVANPDLSQISEYAAEVFYHFQFSKVNML